MHVADLSHGDFVRIRMSSHTPLIYKPVGVGTFELVTGQPQKRDKTWSSALVTGTVIENDSVNGILRLSVANLQEADAVLRATIPFSSISMLQIGVVDIQQVTVPQFLRGMPLKPRIKYERIKF